MDLALGFVVKNIVVSLSSNFVIAPSTQNMS